MLVPQTSRYESTRIINTSAFREMLRNRFRYYAFRIDPNSEAKNRGRHTFPKLPKRENALVIDRLKFRLSKGAAFHSGKSNVWKCMDTHIPQNKSGEMREMNGMNGHPLLCSIVAGKWVSRISLAENGCPVFPLVAENGCPEFLQTGFGRTRTQLELNLIWRIGTRGWRIGMFSFGNHIP